MGPFAKAEQVWQAALGELQLQMTKATFDTWVKNTSLVSFEDGTYLVAVHNGFAKDWLENRLLTIIKRTLVGIVGQAVEVKFMVQPKGPKEKETASADGASVGFDQFTPPEIPAQWVERKSPESEVSLREFHRGQLQSAGSRRCPRRGGQSGRGV